MSKFAKLVVGGIFVAAISGAALDATAQGLAPHPGDNPSGICLKPVGVTYYEAQQLGCFIRPQAGGCHCEDWAGPVSPAPTPSGPVTPGGEGWSSHMVDNQFLAHLKDQKDRADGAEKADLKSDTREFKANLKAGRD